VGIGITETYTVNVYIFTNYNVTFNAQNVILDRLQFSGMYKTLFLRFLFLLQRFGVQWSRIYKKKNNLKEAWRLKGH